MGIKFLNKYLYEKCGKTSITKIHLKELSGKTIVIDTSIYLYHFVGENALMENMYLFISIMNLYNITPIFIFDGKPPSEKRELIRKRYQEKKDAQEKFNELQKSLNFMTPEQRSQALSEMNKLKRQFIRIYDDDIQKVKELMDAYNVTYYNSKNEADDLCVYLVKKELAWGCMSDDMDMFLYGCPYVLRNLSLMNHTITLYKTQNILSDLNLSEKEFREIMTISGTDYNLHSNTSLSETLKWYEEYKKYIKKQKEQDLKYYEFYIWLIKNTKYIKNYRELLNVYQIFCGKYDKNYENIDFNKTNRLNPDMNKIHRIMEKEGFIFA
jgi:flap endonuclease-1